MSISFNGLTKRISLTGTTTLGVRDLWSRWVDWMSQADNSKFLPAFTTLGGDTIDPTSGTSVPIYAFLQNGWRIKPQESNHTLNVTDGILLVDGGGDPFVNTTGNFMVRVNYSQPVQAITVNTGGAVATDPWSSLIEGAMSAQDVLRILLAVAAGKSIVSSDGVEIKFRDVSDTKDRVRAIADNTGQRDAVILDPS